MPDLATAIEVVRDGQNFSLRIDGAEFPWHITADGVRIEVGRDRVPTVSVTIPAESVQVDDSLTSPRSSSAEQHEPSAGTSDRTDWPETARDCARFVRWWFNTHPGYELYCSMPGRPPSFTLVYDGEELACTGAPPGGEWRALCKMLMAVMLHNCEVAPRHSDEGSHHARV